MARKGAKGAKLTGRAARKVRSYDERFAGIVHLLVSSPAPSISSSQNNSLKIFTIVGARPQFVKAAVLSRAFAACDSAEEYIIHSGQHYDANMSEVFFEEMHIRAPYRNLEVNGGSHGAMTGRMLEKLDALFRAEQPDWVVVFGDTNTTLAAALAAKKLGIQVAHIEAGVRSGDAFMPEEINRMIVDRIATLNFCCTKLGVENLRKEGSEYGIGYEVYNYGDVMYDAALYYKDIAAAWSGIISSLQLESKAYVLATIHRESNVDNDHQLKSLIEGLNRIAREIPVVFPTHPRTRQRIKELALPQKVDLIEPVGYFDMLQLIRHAKLVVTDSGGVVREAYFFKKPSIFLLDRHVWPELEEAGASRSVEVRAPGVLYDLYVEMRTQRVPGGRQIFGEGNAGEKIAERIASW